MSANWCNEPHPDRAGVLCRADAHYPNHPNHSGIDRKVIIDGEPEYLRWENIYFIPIEAPSTPERRLEIQRTMRTQARLMEKGDPTIQERFEEFHRLNPQVYESYLRLIRELVARGRTKMGIGMLTEILRWEFYLTTEDPTSDFKISNDYRSRYARLIENENPDLRGIFEKRPLHS